MAIKSILLDTNAYTAFKRNQNEAVAIIGNVDIIARVSASQTRLTRELQ